MAFAQLTHTDAVNVLGQWDEDFFQCASRLCEKNVHVFAVAIELTSLHHAHVLHGTDGGQGGGLHDPCQMTEFTLGQAILEPQNTQKSPVAKRNAMSSQANMQ